MPLVAEGFVLAGGRSTRMGTDKALLQLAGRSLLEIALEKLRAPQLALSHAPRVAGSRPDLASFAPVIGDIHPGCGPLSGIEAALAASTHSFNLFLPVDLPLLPAKLLIWMLHRAVATDASVTFPRINGREQPLCAVYHRRLLGHIGQSIAAGERKVVRAVIAAALDNCAAPGQCVDIFDIESVAAAFPGMHSFSAVPLHRWFENLNSPEDLEICSAVLGKAQAHPLI
jgi:molybdenum cofactor guanylyltransferase